MATMIGSSGPEAFAGTDGGDLLIGLAGDDRLLGRGGDDILSGGVGVNHLDGGPGRDQVAFLLTETDYYGDLLRLGMAVEVDLAAGTYAVGGQVSRLVDVEDAEGGWGDDIIAGDKGANRLFGSGRFDVLFGRGDDLIDGWGDIMWGGNGDDILQGGALMHGGRGDDLLRLTGSDIYAAGGSGADQFDLDFQMFGADIVDFEQGSDVLALPPTGPNGSVASEDPATAYVFIGRRPLTGWMEEDVFTPEVRFEHRDGSTYVQYEQDPWGGVEEVRLSGELELTADDFLLGFDTTREDDAVVGTRFADRIQTSDGNDAIDGLGGADRLDGGRGDDRISGGAGDDLLSGWDGSQTYEGGPGDDFMKDLAYPTLEENDTYVFAGRFGHDVIDDGSAGKDKLLFRGMAASDVVLSRSRDDLTITVKETGDAVLVRGYYRDPHFELVFDQGAGTAADPLL